FALKPFFLLGWAAVEAAIALARGTRATLRAETAAIAAIQLGYALALAAFAPGYAAVAALAWRVLDAYDDPWWAFALNRATVTIALAIAAALWIRPAPETRELRRVLGVAVGAFWLGACLQRRGWTYHFLPAELA